ncbi:MAG: transposase [Gammaproteobacteria bacterium]|jgi:transposase
MKITTLGIDIAKNIFQLQSTGSQGNFVLRKRLRRDQFFSIYATLVPYLVG